MGCGVSTATVVPSADDDNDKSLILLSISELSLRIQRLNEQHFSEYANKISSNAVNGAVARQYLMHGDMNQFLNELGIHSLLHRTVITEALTSWNRRTHDSACVADAVRKLGAAYHEYADKVESNAVGGVVIERYLQRDESQLLCQLLGADTNQLHSEVLIHTFEQEFCSGKAVIQAITGEPRAVAALSRVPVESRQPTVKSNLKVIEDSVKSQSHVVSSDETNAAAVSSDEFVPPSEMAMGHGQSAPAGSEVHTQSPTLQIKTLQIKPLANVETKLWTQTVGLILNEVRDTFSDEFGETMRRADDKGADDKLMELYRRANVLAFKALTNEEIPPENETILAAVDTVLDATFHCASYPAMVYRTSVLLKIGTRLLSVLWLQLGLAEQAAIQPIDDEKKEGWLSKIRGVRSICCIQTASSESLLLGLNLSEFETGILSLPNPSEREEALSSCLLVIKGLIKTVVTMNIDADLSSGVSGLFKLGLEAGHRKLAGSCYEELCLAHATWAQTILSSNAEVQLPSSGTLMQTLSKRYCIVGDQESGPVFKEVQASGRMESVRWELKASFASSLGSIVQSSAERGSLANLDLPGVSKALVQLLSDGDSNDSDYTGGNGSPCTICSCTVED